MILLTFLFLSPALSICLFLMLVRSQTPSPQILNHNALTVLPPPIYTRLSQFDLHPPICTNQKAALLYKIDQWAINNVYPLLLVV